MSHLTVDGTRPKVSVCVITYNHAQYISDCLQSILNQETNFDFEILVGDDCSTDGTTEIVTDFQRRHPGRVKVLRPERNLGVTQNFLALHNAAAGEYVAHLDGDDLALPRKLACQVALLDQKSELSVCGHKVGVIADDGKLTENTFPFKLSEVFALDKVIRCGMPFLTSTIMYRRSARTLFSTEFEVFDWYFLTDLMKSGKAGYLSSELGLYRLHPRSFTGTVRHSDMQTRMIENFARRFNELGRYKSDFFAFAFLDLLGAIRMRHPVAPAHWRLLRDTISVRGLCKSWDTWLWRRQNRAAFVR